MPTEWTLSDEWFADFIKKLERSGYRKRSLFRERRKPPLPDKETEARAFSEKTEQLRRYLAHERKKAA